MANPNRTVAAFRARKMFVVREETATGWVDAEDKAKAWRATGEFARVVATSYRYGSRTALRTQWVVRAYN